VFMPVFVCCVYVYVLVCWCCMRICLGYIFVLRVWDVCLYLLYVLYLFVLIRMCLCLCLRANEIVASAK